MAETQDLADFLKVKRQIEAELKAKGIKPEDYMYLQQLLNCYSNNQTMIRTYQFWEDAAELAFAVNAYSGENLEKISIFLRNFAEHIVNHTCKPGDVANVVDRIPGMTPPPQYGAPSLEE